MKRGALQLAKGVGTEKRKKKEKFKNSSSQGCSRDVEESDEENFKVFFCEGSETG